jgi:hypothetical protein
MPAARRLLSRFLREAAARQLATSQHKKNAVEEESEDGHGRLVKRYRRGQTMGWLFVQLSVAPLSTNCPAVGPS